VELPTSSCHRVLYLRYYKHVGIFSSKPPGGSRGEYYCALGYGRDVNGMGTRDWYLMRYSSSSLTGGQKYTQDPTLVVRVLTA
jgi:hypothetical protein